jgi:hypothetical protein
VADVLSALQQEYYAARGVAGPPDAYLFIAEPSDGAQVVGA